MPSAGDIALGIDLGSSGVKIVAVDAHGSIAARASAPVATLQPAIGHAEQDVNHWLDAVRTAALNIRDRAPDLLHRTRAIALSSAAHIAVLLDDGHMPVRPAILWSDQRSVREAEYLANSHGESIRAMTRNEPTPTWTLPQLRWLASNEPGALSQCRHVVFGKDAIVAWLTGRRVTDITNAASTMLFDVAANEWSAELVELAGLAMRHMPEVIGPDEVAGTVLPEIAADLGIPTGTPVIAGALDSITELLAVGVREPGQAMLRLGTAGGFMTIATAPSTDTRLITYPGLFGNWAIQGFTSSCASSVRWLLEVFRAVDAIHEPTRGTRTLEFSDLDALAESAEAGARGLIFHPYLSGERTPLWDPQVRGSFTGLSPHHGPAELARSVFEGIACSIADSAEALTTSGASFHEIRATGGATASTVLTATIAAILGTAITRMETHGSALGAAMIAGVSAGMFATYGDAIARCVRSRDTIVHDATHEAAYGRMLATYRAVTAALQPIYHQRATTTD